MPSQSLRSENQSRTESREPGSKRMIDVEFDERKIGKVRGWFEHWTACRRKVPNFFECVTSRPEAADGIT